MTNVLSYLRHHTFVNKLSIGGELDLFMKSTVKNPRSNYPISSTCSSSVATRSTVFPGTCTILRWDGCARETCCFPGFQYQLFFIINQKFDSVLIAFQTALFFLSLFLAPKGDGDVKKEKS